MLACDCPYALCAKQSYLDESNKYSAICVIFEVSVPLRWCPAVWSGPEICTLYSGPRQSGRPPTPSKLCRAISQQTRLTSYLSVLEMMYEFMAFAFQMIWSLLEFSIGAKQKGLCAFIYCTSYNTYPFIYLPHCTCEFRLNKHQMDVSEMLNVLSITWFFFWHIISK